MFNLVEHEISFMTSGSCLANWHVGFRNMLLNSGGETQQGSATVIIVLLCGEC